MVLQAVRLQKGLDQAMVLELADDNPDRITAKQLQVKLVGVKRSAVCIRRRHWTPRGRTGAAEALGPALVTIRIESLNS